MTTTTNLGLYAPEETDYFVGTRDISQNMQKIDGLFRKVLANFTGVTISSDGGFKKLCSLDDVLPSGSRHYKNIISTFVYGGTFSGSLTVECYSDGIYLYSSKAFSSQTVSVVIVYTSGVRIASDTDITHPVT